jgi:hypothetical protein
LGIADRKNLLKSDLPEAHGQPGKKKAGLIKRPARFHGEGRSSVAPLGLHPGGEKKFSFQILNPKSAILMIS